MPANAWQTAGKCLAFARTPEISSAVHLSLFRQEADNQRSSYRDAYLSSATQSGPENAKPLCDNNVQGIPPYPGRDKTALRTAIQ